MVRAVVIGLVAGLLAHSGVEAAVVYASYPAPLPPNVDSIGYEDTGTSEFGDAVRLGGEARALRSVTVLLSSSALRSDYAGTGVAAGYVVPLTLSLYNFGGPGLNPTVGSLLARETVTAMVPWRPAATPGACDNGDYLAGNGYCYSGVATPVVFSFGGSHVALPDSLIYGLSFNTQDFGTMPTGTPGPYNNLGFGLYTGATAGVDLNPDGIEWNTAEGSYRSLGPAGVFGPDIGWAGSVPAVTILADVPEPGSLCLLVSAVALAGWRRRFASLG